MNNQQNLSDEQLVAKHIHGDKQAFDLLVQKHLSPIYNFVFKYVHTTAAAEDVTQEAFIKIWKNINKFDPKYKFKTWAFTIAKNTALDHLKKRGLVPFSRLDDPEQDYTFESTLLSRELLPEAAFENIEQMALVGHALAKLPENQKKVLSLYYQQGFNFREIAAALKESINTIKTRHRRAVIFLKKHFEQE